MDDSVSLQKAQQTIKMLAMKLREKTKEVSILKKVKGKPGTQVSIPQQIYFFLFFVILFLFMNSQNAIFSKEILDCLENGRPNKKYSERVRQFSIALHHYSPSAYRYTRSVFHNHLPDPHTIRSWINSVNGSPGITDEALAILAAKSNESMQNGKPLLIAMMSDEMYIRKKIGWDEKEKQFTGFVSCHDGDSEDLPVAKQVLVFMAVGDGFKLTVGYFFLAGLCAHSRAALTQLAIESVNKTGARVISLTGDGLIANVAMVKELGADFNNDKPYFPSPTNADDKIYVIWDPAHMLKLARGTLKSHKLYHDNIPIKWNFITSLHQMQKQRNFNLGNSLSAMHCEFHVKPMNVRLAAETLSNSAADCIDLLCKDGYEEFKNSQKTTEYIRFIKNVFNILNYKPSIGDAGQNFKIPLNKSTAPKIFEYASKAKEYLKSLEIDDVYTRKSKDGTKKKVVIRKLAIKSRKFMGFFGFLHNLTSFERLYNDFVLNGPLDEFHSFMISQDHLEVWFSSGRGRLGE